MPGITAGYATAAGFVWTRLTLAAGLVVGAVVAEVVETRRTGCGNYVVTFYAVATVALLANLTVAIWAMLLLIVCI